MTDSIKIPQLNRQTSFGLEASINLCLPTNDSTRNRIIQGANLLNTVSQTPN
jgi:hypothetical protein